MAKCGFPLGLMRNYHKSGATVCNAKGKFEIVFQGMTMLVCKIHKGYHGRDKLN